MLQSTQERQDIPQHLPTPGNPDPLPFRILIAPDKFKGCLNAISVADAIRAGTESLECNAPIQVTVLPLADGGDGSVEAAIFAGSQARKVEVHGADGQRHQGQIAFDGETAVVEVASTCGLATLTGPLRPVTASSRGLGEAVLAAALLFKPRRIVVGLGGSASTDGGAGMLAALGAKFQDADGNPVEPNGGSLHRVARADLTHLRDFSGIELIGASDVINPLLGPSGAAHIFGPQKGADPATVTRLEEGLTSLVKACGLIPGVDAKALANTAGAGSAGGIGFGMLLLGGSLVSGAGYFLDLLGFDNHTQQCDLVITGEGRLDAQTSDGKLISAVCARSGTTPVWAVVGRSDLDEGMASKLGLSNVTALQDLTAQDTSQDPTLAKAALQEAGRKIARSLATHGRGLHQKPRQ